MTIHTYKRTTFLDIHKTVEELGRKFTLDPFHKNWKDGEVRIRCPRCPDKKYHLGLNFSKNLYGCFRCPFHGRLEDFLRFYKIPFLTEERISSTEATSEALRIKIPFDFEVNHDIMIKAQEYMISRGFDPEFLKNFKFWPITSKNNYYYGYLIFYINDYAFYARRFIDFTKEEAKTKLKHFIRKSDKNMKLYFAYEKNNSKTILVVESMLNLIKAAQFGYNAVCIFGKNKWAGLVEYLTSNPDQEEVCLCFDKDVKIKEIEDFVKRLQNNCSSSKYIKVSYIDPIFMPCNDIADMMDKNILIDVIMKRQIIENLFLNTIIN
jgi:hypothetical protein